MMRKEELLSIIIETPRPIRGILYFESEDSSDTEDIERSKSLNLEEYVSSIN